MVGVRDVHLAAVGWLFEAREREPVLPIHFLSGSGEVHILGVNHLPRHHFVHALRHARHEVHTGLDLISIPTIFLWALVQACTSLYKL
jgi:hypothetical protein